MNSYLSLSSKYLQAHQKKTRLTITSIAIAVALVTGIFSMLDFFLQFEKIQQIHEYGNYHLSIKNVTEAEKQAIASRIDVQNAGTWIFFKQGALNGKACRIDALDENFAPNIHLEVIKGKYPVAANEMMVEAWAAESLQVKVGDRTKITFADNTQKDFIISGICKDYPDTKAVDTPVVLLSVAGANAADTEKSAGLFIEFKKGVNVNAVQKDIQSRLNLTDDRIGRNEYLLAAMGQSTNHTARGLYATGAVLFCIVLIAGVIMIYNTFNISVMERVRQFGLLRCIGASRSQIEKLVKREGIYLTLRGIPIGVLAGMLVAFSCSAILKFYNSSLFGEMALFNVSIVGIIAGIVMGCLTVFIASALPAKKAARISPVQAVTGSNEMKVAKKTKQGFLTKVFPVEIAMGLNNAVMKKRTLFLMACSIAISIVMFLGFQVFVDFMHSSLRTTKPYTPDITLTSEQGLSSDLYRQISALHGTKKVSGRMFDHVEATFGASRLTDAYKEIVGGISVTADGLFVPPEKSWLVSYDEDQLSWAKTDLIAGELSEKRLNEQNGVIAVALPLRNGVGIETAALQLGDKVYVKTSGGTKEMTVMAILSKVPFSDSERNLTTFITTEKLFTELTGKSTLQVIDIQLDRTDQEQTVREIRNRLDGSVSLYDQRQKNAEINGYFLTMAVFIYGFVAMITLISVLNIINTMNTSVVSKTRYLGVIRAVGMSERQLDKMVLVEAATYSLTGCIAGCILGIALQKVLIANYLPRLLVIWKFPWIEIALIVSVILLVTVISVISPLKRVKKQGISEAIGAL